MTTDRRITESQVEIRMDGDKPRLAGYAAKFGTQSGDLGGFIETIHRNAFDAALAENPDVSARVQHQGGLLTVGRTRNGTLKLSVDEIGLRYEATVPNTQAGRDIIELVRGGYIDKSSFAFSIRDNGERWDFSTTPAKRELLSVNLHDVAPVDGPAYSDTSVAVRSMEAAKKAEQIAEVEKPVETRETPVDLVAKQFNLTPERVTELLTAKEPTIQSKIADLKDWHRKHR